MKKKSLSQQTYEEVGLDDNFVPNDKSSEEDSGTSFDLQDWNHQGTADGRKDLTCQIISIAKLKRENIVSFFFDRWTNQTPRTKDENCRMALANAVLKPQALPSLDFLDARYRSLPENKKKKGFLTFSLFLNSTAYILEMRRLRFFNTTQDLPCNDDRHER